MNSGPTIGPHLKLIISANVLFPNRSHSHFPGGHKFLQDSVQPSTSLSSLREKEIQRKEGSRSFKDICIFNDYAYYRCLLRENGTRFNKTYAYAFTMNGVSI